MPLPISDSIDACVAPAGAGISLKAVLIQAMVVIEIEGRRQALSSMSSQPY